MKNNNSDIQNSNDSLEGLRKGMSSLKNSLPKEGLIGDDLIRQAVRSKSAWLNKVLWAEIITLPVSVLILAAATAGTGMNPWCLIVILVFAIPDLLLDTRTLAVSKKWIQELPLVELARKLRRQKEERKWQTIIEAPFALAWMVWFAYEFLKRQSVIPEDMFYPVWGITSAIMTVAATIIVAIVYVKAQRINDEMLSEL